jgi:flagellar hook assembly protein FlgD
VVDIDVYDSAGRCVRRLRPGRRNAGSGEWIWDGHNDAGHELPSGLYVARLNAAGASSTVKLTLLR